MLNMSCYHFTIPDSYTFFFFNDTAPTEIYTLSLHDALPIWRRIGAKILRRCASWIGGISLRNWGNQVIKKNKGRLLSRSEEHTSELQSHVNLVCRLLLEKKKKIKLT